MDKISRKLTHVSTVLHQLFDEVLINLKCFALTDWTGLLAFVIDVFSRRTISKPSLVEDLSPAAVLPPLLPWPNV